MNRVPNPSVPPQGGLLVNVFSALAKHVVNGQNSTDYKHDFEHLWVCSTNLT